MRGAAFWPHGQTLLSALLIVVAHPPLELHAAIWIGLVPWLRVVAVSPTIRAAAREGWWLCFLLGLGGAFWVAHAVPRYLEVPGWVGVAAMLLHAAVHQLQLVAFAVGFRVLTRGSAAPLGALGGLLAAALYTGLDWIVPNLFQDSFGFVLHEHDALRQLAALGGVPLLTFVILVVNLAVYSALAAAAAAPRAARLAAVARALAPAVLLLAAGWAYGGVRRDQLAASLAAPARSVRVGAVQGNVGDAVKLRWAHGDPAAARATLESYVGASARLLGARPAPDLVVWPETAYPGIFRGPENPDQLALNVAFDRFVARARTPFVFGAYDREARRDGARVLRNAIFFAEPLADPDARQPSPLQVYHKHILFPVGETVPLFHGDGVRRWLPGAGDFGAGEGPRVFDVGVGQGATLRLGPSICYEDLFPDHALALARAGAELLVNVSNDSWFGNQGLPAFHLIAAQLRSVETRLPQVRVTNTGISALILPDGRVAERFDWGRPASAVWGVPLLAPAPTPLVRLGDWFGPGALVAGGLGLWLARRRA